MNVPIEVVAGILGLAALAFGLVLMVKEDKINHLRELMRLRMTEGGKIRVTAEEQLAIESVIKAPVSKMGDRDYAKAQPEFRVSIADLAVALRTNDYRQARTT